MKWALDLVDQLRETVLMSEEAHLFLCCGFWYRSVKGGPVFPVCVLKAEVPVQVFGISR